MKSILCYTIQKSNNKRVPTWNPNVLFWDPCLGTPGLSQDVLVGSKIKNSNSNTSLWTNNSGNHMHETCPSPSRTKSHRGDGSWAHKPNLSNVTL